MKRILIADDHDQTRWILRNLLETQNWMVCAEAMTGEDAVERAESTKPDLIVLDQSMPMLDGIVAAERIHATMPNIPIVLLTFYGTEELLAEARKYGVRDVIDKRIAASALLPCLHELLDENRLQPETAGGPLAG